MPNNVSVAEYAELALAVYLEELVEGRRVLYVGSPDAMAAERLSERASRVEVITPRARARGTRRGGRVKTRRWPSADETDRWDVVIVPDLAVAELADERSLERAGAWLAPGGVFVAGARAGDDAPIGYEDLFDLLDTAFDSVRMVGQAPFAGWSVVDFAPDGEMEVTFDGSLLGGGGESAERYFALCGEADQPLDAYTVVQVPRGVAAEPSARARSVGEGGDPTAGALAERLREQQDALDAANVHAEDLERELDDARRSAERAERALEGARTDVEHALGRQRSLEEKAKRLETQLAEPSGRDAGFDQEYATLESALQERGREISELTREVERRGTLVRDLVEQVRESIAEAPDLAVAITEAPLTPPALPTEPVVASPPVPAEPVVAPTLRAPAGTDETITWQPDALTQALQGQVSDALQRAMSAETERAALEFKLDETRGQLAVAENEAREQLEEMRRMEAALRGTVRGLNARLAEVTELYQLTQARLALAEDDRKAAELRNRTLMRQVAEIREQLELEIATASVARDQADRAADALEEETSRRESSEPASALQASQTALEASEKAAAAREGKLFGALMRSRELSTERALEIEELQLELERAQAAAGHADSEQAERFDGERSELLAELNSLGADAERALIQIGELTTRQEIAERTEAALRGELNGVRLRLSDREAAVAELTAARDEQEAGDAPSAAVLGALEARVSQLSERPEVATLEAEQRRVAELSSELEKAQAAAALGADADALREEIAARDAMVARLQTDATHSGERLRELEERLDEKLSEVARLADELDGARAVVDVQDEQETRELTELTDRLETSEADRRGARQALREARERLANLLEDLPEAQGEAPPSDAVEMSRMREKLRSAVREADDKDVMLRSLTAQLQERDDRIRALERLDAGEGADGDATELQARLLELEERAARLTEELAHEREARRRG